MGLALLLPVQIRMNKLLYYYIYILAVAALFTIMPQQTFAQADVKVGDSLTLGQCSSTEFGFLHIDLVVKTRWVDRGLTYDSTTGEGFYPYFFNEGDVDSRRLPCEYAGRRFRIASMSYHKNDDGSKRLVILGQIDNERTVLWIEADAAIAAKELTL